MPNNGKVSVCIIGPAFYFQDFWNRLDFAILLLTTTATGFQWSAASSSTSWLRVMSILWVARLARIFRLTRASRAMRLLNQASSLRRLVNTFVLSLPEMWNIFILVTVVFFAFSMLGTELFSSTRSLYYVTNGSLHLGPDNYTALPLSMSEDSDCGALFANLPAAFVTLTRVATFDNWVEIFSGCFMTDSSGLCGWFDPFCANWWAVVFFVVFQVSTSRSLSAQRRHAMPPHPASFF